MKRVYYLFVLTLVLALLFISCGESATTAPTTTSPSNTTTAVQTTTPGVTTIASTTTPPNASGQPQYGGNLIYVRNTGISALGAPTDIPTFGYYTPLISPVLEPLIYVDEKGNPQPWLAKEIDVSPDGRTIKFTLNQGIKFHDGTDFNAEAVKYNLEACLAANVSGSDLLKDITYDIPDTYTIVFNLKQFDARLFTSLTSGLIGMMASPTALKKQSSGDNLAKDHLVGTGPFIFQSWQRDQYIKYVKNENYWQKGKPYLDSLEMRNNAEVTVSLMSFKAGEVNWVENIDPSDFVALKNEGYAAEVVTDLFYIFTIFLDSANPDSPLANLKVRQAIEYAIDREGMAQGIGMGTMYAMYQCGVEASPWYVKDQPQLKYDPAKAKALLAEAGYPNGFTIPITSDVRVRKDQLVAIQSYLQDVGIKTTLDMADVPRFSDLTKNGWNGILVPGFPNANTLAGWLQIYDNAIFTYPSMIKPEGWAEDWDAVIAEPNADKRYAMMSELLKKIYDQSLVITYIGDNPRGVTDGTIHDRGFYKNGIPNYWEPANVWMEQK